MSEDLRSQRSESAEGKGIAKKAWDVYAAAVQRHVTDPLMPLLRPGFEAIARGWLMDLVGFWVLWHLYGGFEGLERLGYHRSTIFRKLNRFRRAFGAHPDEWSTEGLDVDPKAYWESASKKFFGTRGAP